MPAYNFQSRFAPLVVSGEKRQTIRAIGKRRHAAQGDRIQLYTGMRTKICRKLMDPDPVCTFAATVYICHGIGSPAVLIVGHETPDQDAFARADGFDDFYAMLDWFGKTHGLPFEGVLIKW